MKKVLLAASMAAMMTVPAQAADYVIDTQCVFRDDPASDFGMSRPPISVSSGH